MPTTANILLTFLASPDDLKDERDAVEEVVNGINKQIREFGWQIALIRWEDVGPGYGRPQGKIDKGVDDCELFIGMLWERWGQPTGSYDSGFEEEYERALARRKSGDKPEIWLFFKGIDASKLKDPGDQLKKVLSFRDKQRSSKQILYREFASLDDWKMQLPNLLWKRVMTLRDSAEQAVLPQGPPAAPESAEPTPPSAQASVIPDQLFELVDAIGDAVRSGRLEFLRQDENALGEFEIARINLLAATWMSQRQTGETLGTHEVNLLYKHREQLETTAAEEAQLFRTVLAENNGDVIPGWFWFRTFRAEPLVERILYVGRHDSSAQVRARAIELLRAAKVVLPKELWPVMPLDDDDESVRNEVYRYLGFLGDEATAALLEGPASGEKGDSVAAEARLSILLRLRPEDAFSEIIQSYRYVSDETIAKLRDVIAGISDATLLKAAENEWEQIRELSITELSRRGRFPKDLAQKLTEDPSVSIPQAAFTELATQGIELDFRAVEKALTDEEEPKARFSPLAFLAGAPRPKGDADAVILAHFKSQNTETVLKAVNWFDVKGWLAYKSLALYHFDTVRDTLRLDLQAGFARIKQESIAEMRSIMGEKYAEQAAEGFAQYDDFIRSRFEDAALSGLEENGEPSDIRFGRQYLSNDRQSIKAHAVGIVSEFGDANDSASLLQIWRDSWGEEADQAGSAALRLSEKPFDVAKEMAQSNRQTAIREGYSWLYAHNSDEVLALFLGLLESESATDRERALYFFSNRLPQETLAGLLADQFGQGTYYYNVITWLDRLLYSPEPLREFFKAKLKKTAAPSG